MFDRRVAAVLAAAMSVSALAGSSPHSARLGQTISVDGPRVTPLAVLEDSRCPSNVQCIWAGSIRVKVRVTGGRQQFLRVLELHSSTQIFDGALKLESVTPERVSTRTLSPNEYRFRFSFSGGL